VTDAAPDRRLQRVRIGRAGGDLHRSRAGRSGRRDDEQRRVRSPRLEDEAAVQADDRLAAAIGSATSAPTSP